MSKKIMAAILAGFMLFTAVGCTSEKNGTTDETVTEEQNENTPQMLTSVFKGNTLTLPEEYSVVEDASPYYDKDSGEITLLCVKTEHIYDDNGEYVSTNRSYKTCKYDKDLNLIEEKDINLFGDDTEAYANNCVVLDGKIVCLASKRLDTKNSYYVTVYDMTSGESKTSEELNGLFDTAEEGGWFYVNSICVNKDGDIYIGSENEILVLNDSFVKKFSIPVDRWINSMASSPEGDIYVMSHFDKGSGIARVNPETKSFDDPIYPGDNTRQLMFGDGYDLYVELEDGIYGCTFTEDGVDSVMLMNYTNSDISRSSFTAIAMLNKDTLIASDRSSENSLQLYKKVPDIDLSNIKTVEIVSTEGFDYFTTIGVVNYNKAHLDTRLLVTDYSKYATEENYQAGREKLINDIITGLYKPDIILTDTYSAVAENVIKNNIFMDIGTLIDNDAGMKRDDILGAVIRACSTSDGQLWGLPSGYSVETLVGKTETLGGRTSWTFSEMLDFAKTLPEGTTLMQGLSQQSVFYQLDGLFTQFIDLENHTCDFENQNFYDTLNFIASLPAEYDYSADRNPDNRYEKFQNGQIALFSMWMHDAASILEPECYFNTKDYTFIGYPTYGENSRGGNVTCSNVFVVTNFCKNTDIAWDFIKSVVAPDDDGNSIRYGGGDMPILRERLRKLCEGFYNYEFEFYYSGGGGYGPGDPDNPRTQDDLDEPGVLAHFTPEHTERLIDYIDNDCGSPITEAMPTELQNIISEEITSFTGGAKTAEECAKVIQSRAKIWLAEHE